MKKTLNVLFLALLLVGTTSYVSASTQEPITVIEYKTNLIDSALNNSIITALPLDQSEIVIDENNPLYTGKTPEVVTPFETVVSGWDPNPVSENYAFYYAIAFYDNNDGEIIFEKTLDFNKISKNAEEKGTTVSLVGIFYAVAPENSVNYWLNNDSSSDNLLLTDKHVGRQSITFTEEDVEPKREITIPHDVMDLNNIVEEYIIVNDAGLQGFDFGETDQSFDVFLRLPVNTFKFVDMQGNELKESVTLSDKVGSSYEFDAPLIEGYTLKSDATLRGSYVRSDETILVQYESESTTVEPVKPVEPVEPLNPTEPHEPTLPTPKENEKTLPQTGVNSHGILIGASLTSLGIILVLRKKEQQL